MTDVRKTAFYAIIYFFGVVLNRVVSIIMLPIYTRYLTPTDYGTLEILTMTTDVFAVFIGLGLTSGFYHFYYKYSSVEKRNIVVATVTVILIGLYLVASLIGIFSSKMLASVLLNGSDTDILYFRIIFVIFFTQSFIEIPLSFIKAQQRPYLFIGLNAAKLIVQLSLNILLVVFYDLKILGILLSTLITFLLFGLLLLFFTFSSVGFKFDKGLAKSIIRFGGPFVIANVSDFILTYSDRFFLKAYVGLSVVGIYALGYKMGFMLWSFVVVPFQNIWGPQRFEIAQKNDAGRINHKTFLLYNTGVISAALFISLFSSDFLKIMSAPSFWSAYKIVPLVMLAYIIQAWTSFVNFGILYTEKTKFVAYSSAVAGIVILAFSFLLIPRYAAYGAAISTVIAFFVKFCMTFYFSQQFYYLSLPWREVLSILLFAVSVNIISLFCRVDVLFMSLLLNTILFTVFLFFLFFSPIFDRNDRSLILSILRKPKDLITLCTDGSAK
jgi:O-antigen/teichoic acid export membrane protein